MLHLSNHHVFKVLFQHHGQHNLISEEDDPRQTVCSNHQQNKTWRLIRPIVSVFGNLRVLLKVSPPVIIYTYQFYINSPELFYIEQNGKMKSIYAYPNYATTLSESNLNKYRMFLDQDRILHHRIPLLAPQSGITKAV